MSATKTFRHGQILRLIAAGGVGNQEDLRRRLAQQKLRVTQATLSRDLQELKLAKTVEGYKLSAAPDRRCRFRSSADPGLARIPARHPSRRESAGAENAAERRTASWQLPSMARHFTEIAGTIAGDDTVLIITPNRKTPRILAEKNRSSGEMRDPGTSP